MGAYVCVSAVLYNTLGVPLSACSVRAGLFRSAGPPEAAAVGPSSNRHILYRQLPHKSHSKWILVGWGKQAVCVCVSVCVWESVGVCVCVRALFLFIY